MKKKYMKFVVVVVSLDNEDIIRTSSGSTPLFNHGSKVDSIIELPW